MSGPGRPSPSREPGPGPVGDPAPFEVACPGCQARLTVDPAARVVLAHAPAARPGPAASLDAALAGVRGEAARRDARFQEAAEAERTRKDVLARKFAAGLGRARETPDPPRRPFDGD